MSPNPRAGRGCVCAAAGVSHTWTLWDLGDPLLCHPEDILLASLGPGSSSVQLMLLQTSLSEREIT